MELKKLLSNKSYLKKHLSGSLTKKSSGKRTITLKKKFYKLCEQIADERRNKK